MRAMDIVRLVGAVFAVTAAYAADAPKPGHRPIYRCELNGVLTFSDKACGGTIEVYKLARQGAACGAAASRPHGRRFEGDCLAQAGVRADGRKRAKDKISDACGL